MNAYTGPSVVYLAINLESAADRRERLLQQARAAGIELRLVAAYAGKDLSDEDKAGYDRARRLQEFSRDLTPNEIGCVLSHLKALREFVETGAPYGVIMEDDVLFSPEMKEGIDYIVRRASGWQVLKLFSRRGKTVDITPSSAPADAPVRFIFPKKIYWSTVAILYTREAAEWVLEHCPTYYMAWDAQLSYLLLEHGIPYCAVDPDLIGTFDSDNEVSTIGKRDDQKKAPFCLMRYLRRRLGVIRASGRKKAMRRYMEKHLTVK